MTFFFGGQQCTTTQPLYTTDVHVFLLPFPPCEFLS
jgi:hypothetical protein